MRVPLHILLLAASLVAGVAGDTSAQDETQREAPTGVLAESTGCTTCHVGGESMHSDGDGEVGVTCVGCHGGDGGATEKKDAHVKPRHPEVFRTSANPQNSYAILNHEDPAFIRFVNPGDFRIADESCGQCHLELYNRMMVSIMSHSAHVPAAGLYNNGIHPAKIPVFGEAYTKDGKPAVMSVPGEPRPGTSQVTELYPVPKFEMVPATDAFRVLERGNNDAGTRGLGTDFKVAGGGIVLNKTRLNDPTLWFLGANGSPGDYRSSGCTACHVLYANDRDPDQAGPELAEFYRDGGKSGYTATADPTIPKDEPGHPVKHRMTRRVPVSQCLTCHHHQGNGALGNYVGAMWWDQESDADKILAPGARRDDQNPRSKIEKLWDENGEFTQVQIEDWHGHRWNYRRVYHRDRAGNLLDAAGAIVDANDPDKFDKAVHLKDIHFEKGMHCIDCHTDQDIHGDNRMWGAMIDAIEIRCEDCHGTVTEKPTLITSGVAGSNNLLDRRSGPRTPWGLRQFQVARRSGKLMQRSMVYEDKEWEIPQLVDVTNPSSPSYNARAARAMTLRRDGETYGPATDPEQLAHRPSQMECYTCHSSWNTNCAGCHLSADVNRKRKEIHYEGQTSRAYVLYNPMALRADGFLLGVNGTSKGNKISPMRSASAVVASVRDRGRNQVVHQQNTIATSGHSGFAVTPNPPHTVRRAETRRCDDCHIAKAGDNNAWLAAVLGQGTNAVNFIGEYAYVATGDSGVEAVKVTEGIEPQPVIGSWFHSVLDPKSHARFVKRGRRLKTSYSSPSRRALGIATRGEWVYVADGPGGLRVYDRANIANKIKAQRLVEYQNSGIGQSTRIATREATSVALPSNLPMNPDRRAPASAEETPVADLFRYAFVSDLVEGLIVVDVQTFSDNDPKNNFIRRGATFNPDNKLAGAVKVIVAGNYAYLVSRDTGLHVIDVSDALSPRLVASVGDPGIRDARAVAVQLRYAFVADGEGLKVVDISDPKKPRQVETQVTLDDARDVFLVRTYAYVAAGSEGVAIVDITRPAAPELIEKYTAGGKIADAYEVTTSTVNASNFAFVADGRNGLHVVRLTGPPDMTEHLGFSPRPKPEWIATFKTKGPAVAIADGVSRDRATDESGNQIGVGGRVGSYPMSMKQMNMLLRRNGEIFAVEN